MELDSQVRVRSAFPYYLKLIFYLILITLILVNQDPTPLYFRLSSTPLYVVRTSH